MLKRLYVVLWAILLSQSLGAKEIVLGIEPILPKKMAFLLTPVVIPDLISAKFAFEYRLHRKFNLIIPLEGKWMDYRWAIKTGARLFNAPQQDVPESWYQPNRAAKPGWNIDLLHYQFSSGLGVKYFPFSESMTNAFFIKTSLLAGFEHFNAYSAEGAQDSAVLTHVFTLGYNWVKKNRYTFGVELGEEYRYHTNGIKHMPIIIGGFAPLLQFSLGFTI